MAAIAFVLGLEKALIKRLLLVLAIALGGVVLAVFATLAAADRGAFDDDLARVASRRLGRPVSFEAVRLHLLSPRPTVALRSLKVANPAWAGQSNLVEAGRIELAFRWGDLLRGRLAPSEIEADDLSLVLRRPTRERSSWASGRGGGGPSLASTRRLRITNARFDLDDRVRDLRLRGTLLHDAALGGAYPLAAVAEGVLKGEAVQLSVRGGPLNGRRGGAVYPLAARVQDGATALAVKGWTGGPLQFRRFDLSAAARGPNLADMDYLIGVGLPNSTPYRLTGRLAREGPVTRATGLKATVGRSDFRGAVVSDGSKPRRLISVELASGTLHAEDVQALLAGRPSHALARSVSGAVPPRKGPLLTDTPIDLRRFREKDARLKLSADRFVIGGVAPGRLTAEGVLERGRFDLKPFTIAFPSGRADGALAMDLNGDTPAFRLRGTVRGPLGALVPSIAQTLNGTAELRVDASAAGGSWKAVGMKARGRMGLSIRNGDIQASKAKVLSGAVIQGAFTALANKSARTGLSCAVFDFGIGGGRLDAQRVLLVADAGEAVMTGGIDLGSETIDMTVYGRPTHGKLFAVNAPVVLSGPMLKPQAKVRLGGGRTKDAPKPEIPKIAGDRQAYCDALLAARARP